MMLTVNKEQEEEEERKKSFLKVRNREAISVSKLVN
jgi:hypothetical protein